MIKGYIPDDMMIGPAFFERPVYSAPLPLQIQRCDRRAAGKIERVVSEGNAN
jgi:hypothetical protein